MTQVMLIVRWTARIVSLGLIVLFAVFAVGEGPPPILPLSVHTLMFGLLAVSLVGLLVAWRYEALGAALALSGSVGFYVANFYASGFRSLPSGWVFPLLLATPLLYAFATILRCVSRARRLSA
jgi:hypothetical protein